MLRIATYARINRPDAQGALTAQDERLREHIKKQADWVLVRQFTDLGSGRTPDLPGLRAMLKQAQDRRFGLLLVHRLDRLSRSSRNLAILLAELRRLGIRVCSADGSFDTERPVEAPIWQLGLVFDH